MAEEKEIKNVFVSHYHEDEDSIKQFKDLLSADYCIKNYSVTSEKYNNATNEEYIKSLLRPLINQSSTLICLIGPETHDSKWVDWEIREAEKLDRQIIGVYIQGAKDSDIPPALEIRRLTGLPERSNSPDTTKYVRAKSTVVAQISSGVAPLMG